MTYARFTARKRQEKPFLVPIFLLGIFVVAAAFSCLRLSEAAEAPAKAAITTEITRTVNEAIRSRLSEGDFASPVLLSRDSDGNVTALETDSVRIALLHTEVTQAVIEALAQKRRTVQIPLGDLSKNPFFAGRGPSFTVQFTAASQITCEIQNQFYESGINQTLHRVIAYIRVEVYARLPLRARTVTVEVPYCLAETVIVGRVPEAYTRINRFADDISESEIDDIYDFGAEAQG